MNRIHRTLWSLATRSWQAVPETAKTAGKKSFKASAPGVVASVVLSIAFTGGVGAQSPPAINQLPMGGTVVRGAATIQQTANAQAATMTVNQSSQRAVVNWNTFNIGSAASVNFVQPNAQAVTLNRVNDSNPSQIFGRMTSNGQVVLTNANGVYFAPGSSVDVGGITATTHSISDDNFMSGNSVFERNGATGKVVNGGSINAALGGYVALLAPEVQNTGVVVARAGTVAMASGELITLNIDGSGGLAGIVTTPSTISSLVENKHAVQAPDGQIILSAVALSKLQTGIVKNSGSLEVNSLVSKGGKIYLEANDITLSSTSKLEAKGPTGGGTVLVGGDWQGSGDLRQATQVTMQAGATIDASATGKGDGGKVVLWSDVTNADSVTHVQGSIQAQAGPQGGNGGQVETSGHLLHIDGIQVSTQAPKGQSGAWLLDPTDFTIAAAGGDMTGTRLGELLLNNDITIQTGTGTNTATSYFGTSGTAGNINVNDAVSWSSHKLTLAASNNIYINDVMTATSTASLALNYGQGAVAAANTSVIKTKLGSNNSWTGKINLPAGTANFTTKQGSNGAVKTYTVITALGAEGSRTNSDLQGIYNGGIAIIGSYVLGADIDASVTSTWNTGSGFLPIALNSDLTGSNFTGVFDGLGHTISHLFINRTATNDVGLFRYLNAAKVQNLGLTDVNMTGGTYVGAVAGLYQNSAQVSTSMINNIFTTGQVTATSVTGYAGGMVGYMQNFGKITNSYSQATISAPSTVGGLVGAVDGQSIVSTSYATGNVSATAATAINAGGLVGLIGGSTITDNYALGNVSGYQKVGGLIGVVVVSATGNTTLARNYASGAVTGNASKAFSIAGVIGGNGLAASVSDTQFVFSDNYWNTQTTGQSVGFGISNVGQTSSQTAFTGLTSAQMQLKASFSGFDFQTTPVWTMPVSGSPVLCAFQSVCGIVPIYVLPTSSQSSTYGTAPTLSYCYSSSAASCVLVSYTGIPGTTQSFDLTGGVVSKTENVSGGITGTLALTSNPSIASSGLVNTSNAGTYALTLTPSLTLTGYSFSAGNAVNYTINKANLTQVSANKVYDGLSTVGYAQLSNITGVLGQSFTATAGSAVISDANVATASKTLTDLSGLTLTSSTGGLAANYNLSSALPTGGNNAVTITPKTLTVGGLSAPASRVYDATLVASVSGTPTLLAAEAAGTGTSSDGKIYTGDALTFNGSATGSYNSKDVASANTVTFAGLTSSNSNYALNLGSQAATITPKTLTVSGLSAPASRVYDATLVASVSGTPTLLAAEAAGTGTSSDGKIYTGDALTFNGSATGSYNSKDVASANTVTFAGLTSSNGNYALNLGTQAAAITPADLALQGVSVLNKTYNGNRVALLDGVAAVTPLSGDVVSVNAAGAGGQFNDKNVATGKPVTVSGFTLAGADAGNYAVVQPVGLTADITKADLQVAGVIAQNKTYDATVSATLGGVASVNALAGDVVSLGGNTAAVFSDKNVGNAKAVTASGYSLTGSDAGNYNVLQPSGLTANIARAALTISGITVDNKTYDANTSATVNAANASKTGLFSQDVVTLNVSGTFADKNVGAAKTVNLVSRYGGADAGNYNITDQSTATANITKAPLTLAADNVTKIFGNPNPALTVSVRGLVGGETLATSGITGAPSATTSATVSTSPGSELIVPTIGTLAASNYAFTTYVNGALTIRAIAALSDTEVANLIGAQLSSLSSIQLGSFSTSQLQMFSANHLAALALSQIAGLTGTQIGSLNNRQIQGITPLQLMQFSADQVTSFTADQVNAMTVPQLEALFATQVTALLPSQLTALTPSQVKTLTSKASITWSDDQILSLSPSQITAISPSYLGRMSLPVLSSLSDAQLQALTPEQIAQIAPAQFTAFSPQQILAMTLAQVQNLTPEQLSTFTSAQIASLSSAEIASFDALQLAAIGIYPKVPDAVMETAANSAPSPTPSPTLPSETAKAFEPAIPVMTAVSAPTVVVNALPELAPVNSSVQAPAPTQQSALSVRPSQSLAPTPARSGVLAITILTGTESKPTTTGVAFEQDVENISLRDAPAPAVPPMSDKMDLKDKLTTFTVVAAQGGRVEFQGSVVNNRIIIVAPSEVAKSVARNEMKLVLTAAVTSLGQESRIILANIEGVLLDLR